MEKPIFVVGVPRSGTSFLYRLLGQHPDLGWFSQSTLKKFYSHDYLEFVYLRRRVFGLRNFPYPVDAFGERSFLTTESPVEMGDMWQQIIKGDWNTKITENGLVFLKKIISETLVEQKRKRFVAKDPRNSIKISIISKIFPNSKFVHIIRDGRAVVNSMLKRSKENPSGYFGIPLKNSILKKNASKIEKHALQWKQVIKKIREDSKKLSNNQYMEIRYEDLSNSPEQYMQKISSFCELSPYNYLYRKDGVIYNKEGKNVNGWEFSRMQNIKNRNQTYENSSEIEKYILPELQELGYR